LNVPESSSEAVIKTPSQEFTSTIIAVDPGASGGVTVLSEGNPVTAYPVPAIEADVLHLIRELTPEPARCIAFVELVGDFIGKAQPGSSAFNFGRGFGFLLGVLQERGVRLEPVRPQKWQKWLGLGTASACSSHAEWKRKLRSEAQRRYPALKVTLSTADALLILDYGLSTLREQDGR
jgi:crossover junction endodeoxyribonuclease RuvC